MRRWFQLLGGVGLLIMVGCTSFHREWAAAIENAPKTYPDLQGPWEGRWETEGPNAHGGKLRCIITRKGPGDEHEFFYRAHWKRILAANYRTEYLVESTTNGKQLFQGDEDLGRYGGVFSHKGTASPEAFEARFDSKVSSGTFTMKRPVK